jgi:hypothetical protein
MRITIIFLKEVDQAESFMTIYDRPYTSHDKLKKKQYMDEIYKAQLKAADAKEKILQLYKDNMKLFLNSESAEHTFTGWVASFSYRAETAGGKKRVFQDAFFLDKNLTKVTHHFSQFDILKLTYSGLEDLQYDLGEELNELFEGHEFEE